MLRNFSILIIILMCSRFIGLPANFTPLFAMAIFIPRLTESRLAQFIPTAILIITNLFLEPVNNFIFFSMIFVFMCAPINSKSINNLLLSTIASVLVWHLVVNGSIWLIGDVSLLEVYTAAIPFDFRLLISTSLYIAIFYFSEQVYLKAKLINHNQNA